MGKFSLKKLNTKALLLSLTASAFSLSILLPTLTWFGEDTASPISVDGNVHGSYFESGSGTAADPFEIARPIQLYYLSWLQELGYFNEAVQNKTTNEWELKQQYHFYLSKDIDMDIDGENTYTIPPIGTVTFPFVGSFNGNGHVITDLVISNDVSEYTNDPKEADGGSPSYEILGLFGVLGTTESTSVVNASYIDTSGYIHPLLDNSDKPVTVPYSTDGNYVTNTYLEDVSIIASVDSDYALAGAVAGYSNATVSNIGIKGATLTFASGRAAVPDVGTTNLSDYMAFGFVTEEFKRTVDLVEDKVYQPKATASTYVSNSSGSDWGGSVNFQSLNQRMDCTRNMKITGNVKPTKDRCEPYPIKQTYINNSFQAQATSTVPANFLNGEDIQDSYHYSDANAYGKSGERNTLGSYYYTYRDSGRRIYLGGMSDVGASSVKWVTRITTSDTTEQCYYIRDTATAGTNNYIGITTGGLIQRNAKNNNRTAIFHYDSSDGSLYTRMNDSNGINTVYFLNIQNGAYLIETTNNTTWTKNANSATFSGTPKHKYRIYSGNNYLRCDNTTTPSNTTTKTNSGTIWNITNHGTSDLNSSINITYNGSTYYLNYSGNANAETGNESTTALRLYRAQSGFWKRSSASGNTGISFKNDSKYLRSNGTNWQIDTSERTVSLEKDTSSLSGSYETVDDTSFSYTITQERSGQAGYIPLSANGDANVANYQVDNPDINNLYAAETNTGYIVGGFYDWTNGGKPSLSGRYFGDARVSQYERTRISDSWSNSAYSNIYTIDDSCYNGTGDNATQRSVKSFAANSATAQSFVKLNESLTGLDRILRNPLYSGSTAQISGIHFMASTISTERTIRADAVMINGDYKENYEMPEDSIDFNLKENGYINFLAGNYQSDNNSFFALHKIERDSSDNIVSINKIKYVYKDADDPLGDSIYLYEDESTHTLSWSDGESISNRPVNKTGFTIDDKQFNFAFDTKWIGVNDTLIPKNGRRLYYFEIPVNAGEYALGSCKNGCGGYLVYLDISAASQIIERKTLNELFEINTLSGEIPYGAQYISEIPNAEPVTIINSNGEEEEDKTAIVRDSITSINDLDSYYGTIGTSANGNYTIERNGDAITVSGSNALTTSYLGDGLTLTGSSFGGQESVVIRRIIDYDYNTIVGTYVKQTTTIRIVGTGSTAHNYATTKLEYNMDGFDQPFTTIAIYSYDWVGNGPDFQYSYYLRLSTTQGVSNDIEVNFNNAYNDDFWLTVEYLAQDFRLTCGTNTTIITNSDIPSTVDENNPYPRIQIIKTSSTYDEPDVWYDFTKENGGYTDNEATTTPTLIATFNYTCEGTQVIEENFVYSDYSHLASVSTYNETPTVIAINNGSYIYEFILSGVESTSENPVVAIYYVASGTYVVRYADGSEYILFIDESQQQNP